jgi:hypothetical protein
VPCFFGDAVDVLVADLVGEAEALHGQVQPVERYRVQSGQSKFVLQCGDELMELRLMLEGDVPGVEAPVGSPAGPPVPVLGELGQVLVGVPPLVQAGEFPAAHGGDGRAGGNGLPA